MSVRRSPNPARAGFNDNRLSVPGLIPLVAALGLMLGELERSPAADTTRSS